MPVNPSWPKAAIAALGALGLIGSATAAEPSLIANTKSGTVEGAAKGGAIAFLGIPFAAPPVGANRWKAPSPAAHWTGVRQAKAFSPSCMQVINPPEGRFPWTPEYLIPGPTSEDCLYLNVWKPAKATKGAPVLVFMHGGGYVEGSGSVPVYDGANLAARGIVVVTINYRLGVLGTLAHPDLSKEAGGVSGNYGMQDQIAALRWVKANAAAFGGDPARVTIEGQSAGARSVSTMIASPMAKGLFSRAITESSSGWAPGTMTLSQAEAQGVAFAKKVGATSLAALRAVPADALVKAGASGARWGPIVDGKILPLDPNIAVATGKFNDTPMLVGANADEGSGFESDYGHLTAASLAKARDQKFAPLQAQAAQYWNASTDAAAGPMGKTMSRERGRGFGYEWAIRRVAKSKNPLYIYVFDHPEPGSMSARYGTFHTSEVPYVYQNLNAPRPFTDADRKVSDNMSTRWLSFIKGGAPDAPGAPKWPAFRTSDPKLMLLGDKQGADVMLTPDKRKFFDAIVAKGGKLSSY